MNIPKNSPWGRVQDSEVIADGIVSVSTAGHGGIKLDRKRNAQVKEQWREAGGWYEEDCAWGIAALTHTPEFLADAESKGVTKEKAKQDIENTCKNWYPDFFTAQTGVAIATEDSLVLREREAKTKNVANLVVIAAMGSWHEDVPEGMVGCIATLGGKRGSWCPVEGKVEVEDHSFLVPSVEYDARSEFGFVIDPAKHAKWETV